MLPVNRHERVGMEQGIRTIRDFCIRRKVCVSFDADGTIWHGHPADEKMNCTIQGLAAKIKNDDQRVCHEELVAWIRSQKFAPDGSPLDVLLKASEECLSQQ